MKKNKMKSEKRVVSFLLPMAVFFFLFGSPAIGAEKITLMVWSHFVPAFNEELEKQVAAWAKTKGVEARVDFISYKELPTKLVAEAESKSGHDIVNLRHMDPILFKDSLADMDQLAKSLGSKYGGWIEIAEQLAIKDNHWKAIPWFHWSMPIVYRLDYFRAVGETRGKIHKYTWDDLLKASEKLQKAGHPGGFAINMGAYDSSDTLYPLLWSFGATTVDKNGQVVIDSPETARAIEYVKTLFKFMPKDVLGWDDASNNRYMLSGVGSWTINAPSIYASALKDFPDLAREFDHAPMPAGPKGRFRTSSTLSLGVWKFSKNQELATDLIGSLMEKKNFYNIISASSGFNQPFLKEFRQHPIWRQTVPLNAYEPVPEELRLAGWPGPSGPEAQKVFNMFVIPVMFAKAVTGTPTKEAMEWAEGEIKRLYGK